MQQPVILQVRMTTKLHKAVVASAEAMNLKTSEWVRLTLATAIRREQLAELDEVNCINPRDSNPTAPLKGKR